MSRPSKGAPLPWDWRPDSIGDRHAVAELTHELEGLLQDIAVLPARFDPDLPRFVVAELVRARVVPRVVGVTYGRPDEWTESKLGIAGMRHRQDWLAFCGLLVYPGPDADCEFPGTDGSGDGTTWPDMIVDDRGWRLDNWRRAPLRCILDERGRVPDDITIDPRWLSLAARQDLCTHVSASVAHAVDRLFDRSSEVVPLEAVPGQDASASVGFDEDAVPGETGYEPAPAGRVRRGR